MCGIIGYVGSKKCKDIILTGLTNLEYRGYDSSGISVIENNSIETIKAIGKLKNLKEKLKDQVFNSNIGIGHTRWATHGEVTLENAHPHNSTSNNISLVHNGIIENYLEIKKELVGKNISFYGKTDTEVIVKYIESIYEGNPLDSLNSLTKLLKGSYALAILFSDYPNTIFFIKKDSPLLIGIGQHETYLSSDYSSISEFTNKVVYLKNNQYGYITKDEVMIYKNKHSVKYLIEKMPNYNNLKTKDHYSSYLEKEIYETESVMKNILSRYIKKNDIDLSSHPINSILNYISNINILGCGSSYHVGLVGKYLFENIVKIPTNVSIASEYRYLPSIKSPNTLNILISQSGETADLISCISLLNDFKLGIINVKNSSISLQMDDNFFLEAGNEISVATTKAYIGQLTFLYLLCLKMGYKRKTLSKSSYVSLIKELKNIPNKIHQILYNHQEIKDFAAILKDYNNVFFIGRGLDYLSCIEGSLKLKEVTYIHSEAISSGELKHGTISLIDKNIYVISLLSSSLKEKTLSNVEEVKARQGNVFTISTSLSNYNIPETKEIFYPLLQIIPLQLLSLYTGIEKKLDIDKPRNLAKSVTVE